MPHTRIKGLASGSPRLHTGIRRSRYSRPPLPPPPPSSLLPPLVPHPSRQAKMAAADTFKAYSPTFFHSLPDVGIADAEFKAAGGLHEALQRDLTVVIADHPVAASRYGLQLLHRHSDLDDDEVMLGHSNTTIPVKRKEISEAGLDRIHPTIWGMAPDSHDFIPLEFAFAEREGEDISPELDSSFAETLSSVLHAHGLEHLLGLSLIRNDMVKGVETTSDRANIVMPADVFSDMTDGIQVLWQLGLGPSSLNGQPHSLAITCRLVCLIRRSDGAHFDIGHQEIGG
ncbi:hypothetical protein V8E36_002227 [Tilletia maclaganii]